MYNSYHQFSILIVQCPILNMKSSKSLGDNTLSDVNSYTYFNPDHFCKINNIQCDVLLFTTIPNCHKKSNLLLCRYYSNELPTYTRSTKINLFKQLLNLLQSPKKNKYLERNRIGGSSGVTNYTDNLLKLIHNHNSSPRKGKGVVFLRQKSNCSWRFFYIGTIDGKVHTFVYGNPQIGGKFHLKNEFFFDYPFLKDFCMSKALTSLIITSLQYQDIISPQAISFETNKLHFVCNMIQNDDSILVHDYHENWDNLSLIDKFCLTYNTKDTYTLVCHPVGRHNDYFSRNIPSKLENRFCMFFELDKHLQTNIENLNGYYFPCGRGGNGVMSYSFAVLDW
mgnify:FL=1